jgi:NAD(P)-dependent dehydrogenase (short-subunit alcohol dehydrogenase family)
VRGKASDRTRLVFPAVPSNLDLDVLLEQFGAVGCLASGSQVASGFPFAASQLGHHPIVGLLALSRLVGMICPGLHSIFAALDVTVVNGVASDFVSYKVTSVDKRFRYVTQSVDGAGLLGTVEAFVRHAPAEQPGIDELSKRVDPTEFRSSVALIIGGSRGLGEVTAKILAAGGAHVIISYSIGRADADRVASSIRAAGRTCEVIHYDVSNAFEGNVEGFPSTATHVYYFATGPIRQSRTRPFDSERFDEFCAFYVKGFAHLCSCLRSPTEKPVRVFYPSSVYISADDRPQGFAEYGMAKSAGEALCVEITRSCPQIEVFSRRLPPMRTDQTASFLTKETDTQADVVMLAAIRAMHGK